MQIADQILLLCIFDKLPNNRDNFCKFTGNGITNTIVSSSILGTPLEIE